MGHIEPTFLISHSHIALQGTNSLIGRFLDEYVRKIGEHPIIHNPYKPIFSKKLADEEKN